MAQSNFNEWTQNRQKNTANGQDAPLAGVDTNQYKYASFIYPLDLGSPGAGKDHYIVFHINETSRTQFTTRTVSGTQPTDQATATNNANANLANNEGGGIDATPIKTGEEKAGQNGNETNDTDYEKLKTPIRRVATTIVLPMPNDIRVNYEAKWEAEDLGVAADIVNKAKGASSWSDVFKSGGASALKQAGVRLNDITGLNLDSAISRQTRLTINNHQEVIFNGVGFRPFTFSFRFTPESEAEATNVDNIIRAFKFYSAPEVLQGTAGRFWIYPAEFDIQYFSNGEENQFLNKISTCALTDMQVNYTPAGHWSAHRPHSQIPGSSSVCIDITLTFRELEIMTKRRILEGY